MREGEEGERARERERKRERGGEIEEVRFCLSVLQSVHMVYSILFVPKKHFLESAFPFFQIYQRNKNKK